jgi:hypothetical protein
MQFCNSNVSPTVCEPFLSATSSGSVGLAEWPSVIDTNAAIQVASSTATRIFEADSTARTHIFDVTQSGASKTALSIAGNAGGTTPLLAISSSTAAFATTTVFKIDKNGNVLMSPNGAYTSIASSTFTSALGILGIGTDPTTSNSTTTITVSGKLQWDFYDTAGARECAYFVSTTLTVSAGPCTP